ncbi:MAG: hypothetical protein V4629_07860 [Pseudomonadota bacterium]
MHSTASSQVGYAYRSGSMSPAIPKNSKNLNQIECASSRPSWFQSTTVSPTVSPLMNLQNIKNDFCPILRQPNSVLERPMQTLRGGSGATIYIIRSIQKPLIQRGFLPEIKSQEINIARKCMPTNHTGLNAFMRDVEAGACENNSHFLQNNELNELLKARRPRLLDCYSVTSPTLSLFVADYPCVTDTDDKDRLLQASKPLSDYIMQGPLSVDTCVDHTLNLVKQLIQEQKIYGLQDIPLTDRKNVFLSSYGDRALSRWQIQSHFSIDASLIRSLKYVSKLSIDDTVYKNPVSFIEPIIDALGSFSKGLITHGDCQQSNNLLQRMGSENLYRNQRIDTRPLGINDSFMDVIKLLAGPAIIQSVDRMHTHTILMNEDFIQINQHPKDEKHRLRLNRLETYHTQLDDYLIAGNGAEKIDLTDFNKFCQKIFQHVANNSQTQENYAHLWLRLTTWVELACAGGFCFQGLQKSETIEEQLDFTNRTLTFVCAMAKELPKIKMHLDSFLEMHKNDISLNDGIKNQLLTLQNAVENIHFEIFPEQ